METLFLNNTQNSRYIIWPAFIFLLLISFIIRIPYFGDPAPDFDEQFYFLVGSKLLSGQWPYVDLWDRKPFLLFAINAAASATSGGMPLGYQLFAAAGAGIGAIQVFVISKRFGTALAGVCAGIIYLLGFPLFWAPMGQSEVFYIPFILGMLQLLIAMFQEEGVRRATVLAAWTMLLGGLALQIKYTVLPHCLFAGIASLVRLRSLGLSWRPLCFRTLVFALIGLAPTSLIAGVYAAAGHFNDFWYANFVSIFGRQGLVGVIADAHIYNIITRSALMVALAAAGVLRMFLFQRGASKDYRLVLCYTGASVIAFLMVGNVYSHYFLPVVPGLAMLSVPFISASRMNGGFSLASLAIFILLANFPFQVDRARAETRGVARALALVSPYVDERNCMYVFDGPSILYQLSGSCILTKYAYPDHLNNTQEMNSIGVNPISEVQRILLQNPTTIVMASEPIVPKPNKETTRLVQAAVSKDYILIGKTYVPPRTLFVYARRGEAADIPR